MLYLHPMGLLMTDAGYSSNYEVYLTPSNGIQIVTNELSLRILSEMRRREVSPTEMAMMLHLPKSTIQGNIGKLHRIGIVSQSVCLDDARSAVYRLEARMLFCSGSDSDWQRYARVASVKRILRNGGCTSREDLSLYAVSLMESGLDVIQGLFNVGAALSRGIGDMDHWSRMLDMLRRGFSEAGIRADMETSEALKLRFRSDSSDISDIPLILVPMLGAIAEHSKELLGYELCHEIDLSIGEGGRIVNLQVNPFRGQEVEDAEVLQFSYTPGPPFSIYSIDGSAVLFTNPTMKGILDALLDGDLNLYELESRMKVPRPTVYASAAKLISLGAIKIVEDSGTPKKYALTADPILYMDVPEMSGDLRMKEIISDYQNGRIDYSSAVISYSMTAIGRLGIHFDKMFVRAGRNTVPVVTSIKKSIKAQDFVDLSCEMVSKPDSAEVVSYIPLELRVNLSKDTLWESWPADFIVGFLDEGLYDILGLKYPITVKTYHEGEKNPSSSVRINGFHRSISSS